MNPGTTAVLLWAIIPSMNGGSKDLRVDQSQFNNTVSSHSFVLMHETKFDLLFVFYIFWATSLQAS